MIKIIKQEEYRVSRWRGGTTTQIFIWPENGDYGSREFDFRISSAIVEEEQSEFTRLEGVKRFLTVLQGRLELEFNHKDRVILHPYEICEFDGNWHTLSEGRATDFNLMIKNGTGSLESLCFTGEKEIKLKKGHNFFYSKNQRITIKENQGQKTAEQGETIYCYREEESGIILKIEEKEPILRAWVEAL